MIETGETGAITLLAIYLVGFVMLFFAERKRNLAHAH
jgi:hypothetical protein